MKGVIYVSVCYLFVLWGRRAGMEVVHLIGPTEHRATLCLHSHLKGIVHSHVHSLLPMGAHTQRGVIIFILAKILNRQCESERLYYM